MGTLISIVLYVLIGAVVIKNSIAKSRDRHHSLFDNEQSDKNGSLKVTSLANEKEEEPKFATSRVEQKRNRQKKMVKPSQNKTKHRTDHHKVEAKSRLFAEPNGVETKGIPNSKKEIIKDVNAILASFRQIDWDNIKLSVIEKEQIRAIDHSLKEKTVDYRALKSQVDRLAHKMRTDHPEVTTALTETAQTSGIKASRYPKRAASVTKHVTKEKRLALTGMKRAVILGEIIDKPVSLR